MMQLETEILLINDAGHPGFTPDPWTWVTAIERSGDIIFVGAQHDYIEDSIGYWERFAVIHKIENGELKWSAKIITPFTYQDGTLNIPSTVRIFSIAVHEGSESLFITVGKEDDYNLGNNYLHVLKIDFNTGQTIFCKNIQSMICQGEYFGFCQAHLHYFVNSDRLVIVYNFDSDYEIDLEPETTDLEADVFILALSGTNGSIDYQRRLKFYCGGSYYEADRSFKDGYYLNAGGSRSSTPIVLDSGDVVFYAPLISSHIPGNALLLMKFDSNGGPSPTVKAIGVRPVTVQYQDGTCGGDYYGWREDFCATYHDGYMYFASHGGDKKTVIMQVDENLNHIDHVFTAPSMADSKHDNNFYYHRLNGIFKNGDSVFIVDLNEGYKNPVGMDPYTAGKAIILEFDFSTGSFIRSIVIPHLKDDDDYQDGKVHSGFSNGVTFSGCSFIPQIAQNAPISCCIFSITKETVDNILLEPLILQNFPQLSVIVGESKYDSTTLQCDTSWTIESGIECLNFDQNNDYYWDFSLEYPIFETSSAIVVPGLMYTQVITGVSVDILYRKIKKNYFWTGFRGAEEYEVET